MSDITSTIEGAISNAASGEEAPVVETTTETPEAPVESGLEVDDEGATLTEEEKPAEAPVDGETPAPEKPAKRKFMPYDRHEAVLTNTRTQHTKELSDLQARYKPYESEEFKSRLAAIQLAEQHPEAFLAILKSDPKYAALLAPKQQEQQEAAPEAYNPDPDAVMADGTLGFSAETVRKLVQSTVESAVAKTRADLEKTIGPIVQTHQDAVALSAAEKRLSPILQEARTSWVDFAPNEQAIRQVFLADKRHTLESAYRTFMQSRWSDANVKLEAQREAIREEERKKLVAQMDAKKKASASAGTRTPGAGGRTEGSGDPITSAIMDSIAALK